MARCRWPARRAASWLASIRRQQGAGWGQEAELWVDARACILFDPEDGRNLTTDKEGPAATGGQEASGREPEPSASGGDSDGEAAPGATGGTR